EERPMTPMPGPSASPFTPRKRDRRRGLAELLSALAHCIGDPSDPSAIRGNFEETVRRIVPVRSVRLRQRNGRPTSRAAESSAGAESIALDVPGPDMGSQGVL